MAGAAGTLLAALAATGALWFTGQSLHATNTQLGMSQQTAVTDRFRLAAEQLSSDKIDVRVAGIYLFERLAKDSPSDHVTVYSVLAAFVRTRAPASTCPPSTKPGMGPVDIQVAMTVIGRRDTARERPADKPDLNRTCLAGIDLGNANLFGTNLTDTDLAYASLAGANLRNANLAGANLTDADLAYATLSDANLGYANLTRVDFSYADLTDAILIGANLIDTRLTGANLTRLRSDTGTQWPKGFTPPLPR